MTFCALYFHTLLLFFTSSWAQDGAITYEKFYRLNRPIYRSQTGDWLGLNYKKESTIGNLKTFFSGDLRFYFRDNQSLNTSIQEAYLKRSTDEDQLFIGRRILKWNPNEKYWMLGYLNSLKAFTLLGEEEEGLTGILYSKTSGDFQFDFFFSYLFIPQLNPSVKFKNGQIESHSEWIRIPPSKTVVNGTTVPIFYKIKKIDYDKIVLNKSLGLNLTFNFLSFKWNTFALYKPENRLRINAEAYYDNITLNQVVVEADPTVNHHAYYGLNLTKEFGQTYFRGGLSYIDPNAKLGKDIPIEIQNGRKKFKSDYFTISPRYDKEAYSHVSTQWNFKNVDLSLNYVHLLSKNVREADDFFSDTVKWKRAFGGSINIKFFDALSFSTDLKYDIERADNILKMEMKYNHQNKLYMALGLFLLKAPRDESYWSAYRTNDTVFSTFGLYF